MQQYWWIYNVRRRRKKGKKGAFTFPVLMPVDIIQWVQACISSSTKIKNQVQSALSQENICIESVYSPV